MKGLQLPLGVQLADTASFDSFHAGPNGEALAALRTLPSPAAPPVLLLFGPAGSGKTHLLQALSYAVAARHACAYLPLRVLGADAADAFAGFDSADVVCIDDLDARCADRGADLALLRLLDGVRAHGGHCVLSANAAPARLDVALPDLATRLRAAAVYGLKPLTDADREQLLRGRARARGLELSEDAARYLLSRLQRDAGSLLAALDGLDRASLSAQRRLTLPFVQRWLQDKMGTDPFSAPPETAHAAHDGK